MTKTSKAKKAREIVKKVIGSLLVLILTVVAVAGVYLWYLYTLATDMSEAYRLEITASENVAETFMKSIENHEMLYITDEQLSLLCKKVIEERINTEENADNDVVIKDIAVSTRKNNRGTIYAKISFHDIEMIYSVDMLYKAYRSGQMISISVGKSKVGKLGISDSVMFKAISESFKGQEDIKVYECGIQIPNTYTFEYEGNKIQLEIRDIITHEVGKLEFISNCKINQ